MVSLKMKILSSLVLLSLVFSLISPILLYPRPALAVLGVGDVVTDPLHTIVNKLGWVWDRLKEVWKEIKKNWAAIFYKNALRVFLFRIAQDTATYIATGGKGQGPLFLTSKDYWKKLGDDVLGTYINDLAKESGFTDQNLCDPINLQTKLRMLISLGTPQGPKVECSLSQIRDALRQAVNQKLFDFKVDLEEGPVAQYKSYFSIKVSADTVLKKPIKRRIVNLGEKIVYYQDAIASVINSISENPTADKAEKAQKRIEEIRNNLQKRVMGKDNSDPEFLIFWLEQPPMCAGMTPQELVCNDRTCAEKVVGYEAYLTPTTTKPYLEECLHDEKLYTKIITVHNYARELRDWVTQLDSKLANLNLNDLASKSKTELEDLAKQFDPRANDIGVFLNAKDQAETKVAEEVESDKTYQQIEGEMKGPVSKISGVKKSPGAATKGALEQMLSKATGAEEQFTGNVLADAIGVFLNTLISKLLKRIFEKGLNPRETAEKGVASKTLTLGIRAGQAEAKLIFADLSPVSLIKGEKVNILEEFTTCPTEIEYALPNSCVMDTDLARAVEEEMTIAEAMEKNLLHPDWIVGSLNHIDTVQDYNSRYSLTNIKKMRRARIVPLGLEIAAEKITRGELGNRPVTLKEVVDGFYQYGQDGKCGTNDKGESPFCNLVDPGWVLKAPAFQCRVRGYSALPQPGSAGRQTICLDYRDCVEEDEKGNCQTWGYCTREKNIWSLQGDPCLSQYASCQSYERVDGNKFSYIKDSLDFRNCDASQVGCQWYCQDWDKTLGDLGNWACVEPGKSFKIVDGKKQEFSKADNAIFFNRWVEKCDPKSNGCWQYIRTKEGLGTNLLINSGFDDFIADQNGNLTEVRGWKIEGGQFLIDEKEAQSGQVVAGLNQKDGGVIYNLKLPLFEKTRYTFSLFVNNLDDQIHILTLKDSQGSSISSWEIPAQSGWQRIQASFFNQEPKNFDLVWRLTDDNNFSTDKFVYLDDLQLEAGARASTYKSYGLANLIYLKKPPSYLNCQPDSPEPACFDYALTCKSQEVGCELYLPTTGEPALTGVAKETDFCPKECVGYQDFRQASSNFSQIQELVSFIPKTAKTCSAQAKGCAEFTNLDEVAKGGEGKEYYTYLRQCAKLPAEEASCRYYFTWIGSDTAGYQLKRYYLKKGKDNGPAIVPNPNLELGQCENENDAIVNPHCKQFYDDQGNVYYRIYENTITCSEDCHPYRKTEPAILNVSEAVCQEIGGQWVDGRCEKTNFMAIPSEGISCPREQNGCEEYKGSTANNLRYLFYDDFENETIGDWGPQGVVGLSTESIKQGGHSLKIKEKGERKVNGLILRGKTYLLSFWIKGTPRVSAKFKSGLSFGQVNLPAWDWYSVTLGPVIFDQEPDSDEKIIFTGEAGPLGFYLDNVVLKEITQSLYLIKNSWKTPAVCDQDLEGNYLPGAMVGCQLYRNRFGKETYLKSFTRLCPERAVGCEALIDTQNSSSPFEEKFNQPSPDSSPYDNVIVPADQFVYLVNDPLKACQAQDKGCQKFGLPKLDFNGQAIDFQTVYLKNDPDLYQKKPILCQAQGLGCQEFRPTNSQTSVYFHDPGDKVCEYRENVLIDGQYRKGWFKKPLNEPCYPDYLIDGVYGLRSSSDEKYQGWVGLCPEDQSTCTKFIDPIDSGPSKEYYYLNNERLDKASCQGKVSLKQGCVLFRDTSITDINNNLQLYWNSKATYLKSEKLSSENYGLVSPIDCQKNPQDQYCQETNQTTNDANLILKVKRDRTCAQWLSCSSGIKVWDKNTNEMRLMCDQLERCQKSKPQAGQTNQTDACLQTAEPGYSLLSEAVYKARDVSWQGLDYSGYSLYNFPPIEKMTPTVSGLSGGPRLISKTCRAYPEETSPFTQTAKNYYPEVNVCQLSEGNRCVCDYTKAEYSGITRYYPIDAGPPPAMTCNQQFHKDCGDCMPSPKGPFEYCGECKNVGKDNSRCEFCQIDRGDRTSQGAEDCSSCKEVDDCQKPNMTGTEKCIRCNKCVRRAGSSPNCPLNLTKLTDYLGWYGYCLEPDLSKPLDIQSCLTWYPIDLLPGTRGFYNWSESAGYRAPFDRQWYCLRPLMESEQTYSGGGGGGGCFTGKTLVLMADGSSKKIEEIKPGEMVLTRESENSAKLVSAKVLKKFEHLGNYLIININNILEVTPEHIMFVNGQWKPARDIKIGDKLIDQNNQEIIVKSIKFKKEKEKIKVYNLKIEKYQTYFADGFYVHNQKCADDDPKCERSVKVY